MASATVQHIESLLRARKLDGTLAKPEFVAATAATGLAALDDALGGGWRRGEVSEIVGAPSSGRTSIVLATLAAATARGEVVSVVDSLDRFDPASAAAAGVVLSQVLWVRGPSMTSVPARTPLAEALVRRALRAADLIVRAGGFGVVVLDLADVPMLHLRRVPLTSWMRLAHANEGRDTVCVLLADAPIARSPRGVSTRLTARPRWTGDSAQRRRLDGLDVHVQITSARHMNAAEVRV